MLYCFLYNRVVFYQLSRPKHSNLNLIFRTFLATYEDVRIMGLGNLRVL